MRNRRSNLVIVKVAIIACCSGLGLFGLMEGPSARAFSSGPPAGYTLAPGEDSCTECHGEFPLNSGVGSVQITGLPHDYLPNRQVLLHVTTTDPTASLFGFEVTAVDRTGSTVGTFSVPAAPAPPAKVVDGVVGSWMRQYVEQTTEGLFDPTVSGSNTWTFTWTTPAQRTGKVSFYASGNAANGNGSPSGDFIYTTSVPTLAGSAVANFDGDFASDVAVFRPRTGTWYSRKVGGPTVQTANLGAVGDKAVAGDYDGDGTTDRATFRPATREWRIQRSSLGFVLIQFGAAGDLPVPGDFDGDGKTDIAVFRPATGLWSVQTSSGGTITATVGQAGDKLTAADYDGDAKADFAVFRPSNGTWYLLKSSAGSAMIQFGAQGDLPVPADYDGDGLSDLAYYRPSTGTWYVSATSAGSLVRPLGQAGDTPSPGDYDGDGKADLAVFHPGRKGAGATWQILRSSDMTTVNIPLGMARDIPVVSSHLAN